MDEYGGERGQAKAGQAQQQDGPAPEPVAEISEHRGGEELHGGKCGEQRAQPKGGAGGRDMAEPHDEIGLHRNHDAKGNRIQRDDHENK